MRVRLAGAILLLFSSLGSAHAMTHDEARITPQWQALDASRDGEINLDEVHP